MSEVSIRLELPDDVESIRHVHERAFDSLLEAELVDNLQAEGDAILSLVARCDEKAVGHILFSRLSALEARGLRASALGPLGVLPEYRDRGIATALVREGISRLRADSEDLILVLGDPEFYGKFGFRADAARVFQTPYDGPHLQAMALSDAGHLAQGVLRYAPAFAMLT
jgi:putative acetyltransferase